MAHFDRAESSWQNIEGYILSSSCTFLQSMGGSMRMKTEGADWPSVLSGAQSFTPFSIPIMLKMGRVKHNRINVGLRMRALGNLDLMKVHEEYCLEVIVKSGQY